VTGPLVSVIVPVYNGESFLAEALTSLFTQDYAPFEAIVVDDGSTDRTREIANSFDVRCFAQPNSGQAAARNTGITEARGEFIAFLDADDVLPPNKLTVQARYLLEHPEIGCVLGRQEIRLEGIEPPPWLTRDALYGDLGGINPTSAMIRAQALRDVGGFDPSFRFAEDRDLLIRLREAGVEMAVISDLVLYRRLHGTNVDFVQRTAKHPLLRSLKAKADRGKATGAPSAEGNG
jgi:glycosyltransferase involved in cell wall biosynthesis